MARKLPEDVWALILAHVPQADRLKHCALVCTKLSRAAAAATDALQVSLWRSSYEQQQQRAEAFRSYLQHHGSHVTSLVLNNEYQPLMRLPCPQLLHLAVTHARPVQLGPHGGVPGVDSFTALTSLKLFDCIVAGGGGLSRLSVLVELRDLHLCDLRHGCGYATLPGSVLASLMHLTRLDLSRIRGVQDLHRVSSLTSLSVLSIKYVEGPQPLRLAPGIAPGFVLPASLQQLSLGQGVELDPAVFAAATQLTSVELMCTRVEVQGGGVSSGAALLAAVAGLQQLDTLELRELGGVAWPAPSAAYTALTASSKLQKLRLFGCGLPEGVWEHVFPPAHSCPALREFGTSGLDYNCWDAGAVSRLVRCCPVLLDLRLRLSGAPAVAALMPLTALSALELFVDCTHDQAGVSVSVSHVAALANLQRLDLSLLVADEDDADAAAAGAASLLALTALRQLTECSIRLGAGVSCVATNKAGPGQPPDVWLQVLEQCLEASNCQPAVTAVTKQLAQQLAQHQQRFAQQEQRMAQQEQQHAERLAQQERQTQELQQQVTALQQQVAGLPALQAQVQQLMQLLPQPEQR